MAVCKTCNGLGKIKLMPFGYICTCAECKGTGETRDCMTNEEYLKSLDTEQLAKRLHNSDVYAFFVCKNGGKVPSVEHYVEWLKEIHHAE